MPMTVGVVRWQASDGDVRAFGIAEPARVGGSALPVDFPLGEVVFLGRLAIGGFLGQAELA